MSEHPFIICPWVKQLWPPEGNSRVTKMDVVFFSDLEGFDREGAARESPLLKPGETWLQKGHPEVCWPQQWLPEDLGSNVRIFEIRPFYFPTSTVVKGHSVEEAALRQLDSVARQCVYNLHRKISIGVRAQGRPLVFVGHGYGGLMLKQTLVEFHRELDIWNVLPNILCGIVFYVGTNTKCTNKHGSLLMKNTLSKLSEQFGAALDVMEVEVCVIEREKEYIWPDIWNSSHYRWDNSSDNSSHYRWDFFDDIRTPPSKDGDFRQPLYNYDFSTPTSEYDQRYLKHQFNDDMCAPTSKGDASYFKLMLFLKRFLPMHLYQTIDDKKVMKFPHQTLNRNYFTLPEFLRQFLPKGLYQTIDDKKGREIPLRLREIKDKEALGDMETASTSTRENRDKEMDVRQCVVLHVVGNIDQDHDMLVQEAHKLQAFLCPKIEMAQGHGGSIILPNLHELHSKFLEDTSIFAGARKNVEMDSIEFLFLDAQCMSKVVGVGLHQALVTITSDNDVKVDALSESAWKCSLASMFKEVQDLGAFELIGFKMLEMEVDNIQTMNFPGKEGAKQFGIGLKDFLGDRIVTMNWKEESNMLFPIIWKVAKVYKAFKEGDRHVTKRPSGVGSSTSAAGASSRGSNQQGKEEGKSVRSWSQPTWLKWGKGDEKDDENKPPGGDPPPDSEPSSEPEMVPCRFTVKVYPNAGCTFRVPREIPPQIKTVSMNPKLTIVFSRDKTGAKFLDVTTQTQCHLGCDAEHYFGWFQDDIKISFRGSLPECEGVELKNFIATDQRGEEGELTKETTNITLGGSTSVANLESRGMCGQGMVIGSGIKVQGREDTTKTFGQNSSRADTEEVLGVKQIDGFNVHNRNVEEDLIYKFCIPTGIKNGNNPMRFLRYSDTFTPIIVGNWEVSMENAFEAANYTFKVERHLFHIEQGAFTFGKGCPQDYVLEMFINLAMTHLDGLRSDKTIEIRQQKFGRSFGGPGVQLFPV